MEQAIVEMYWRPGCPFCVNLERGLNSKGIAYAKRNIWEDPSAAEYVRSVANGNEVVPTVKVGKLVEVNPSVEQVEEMLR